MPNQKPAADPMPPQPKEDPITDQKIAAVQVVPLRRAAQAGRQTAVSVRLFNATRPGIAEVAGQRCASSPSMAPARLSPTARTQRRARTTINARSSPARWATRPARRACASSRRCLGSSISTSDKNVPLTWIGGRVRWEVRDDRRRQVHRQEDCAAHAEGSQQQARHAQLSCGWGRPTWRTTRFRPTYC